MCTRTKHSVRTHEHRWTIFVPVQHTHTDTDTHTHTQNAPTVRGPKQCNRAVRAEKWKWLFDRLGFIVLSCLQIRPPASAQLISFFLLVRLSLCPWILLSIFKLSTNPLMPPFVRLLFLRLFLSPRVHLPVFSLSSFNSWYSLKIKMYFKSDQNQTKHLISKKSNACVCVSLCNQVPSQRTCDCSSSCRRSLCHPSFLCLSSVSLPNPSPLWRRQLKAHACPKINLDEGLKLKAEPQEFYYVLMFELLTWIVLLNYE